MTEASAGVRPATGGPWRFLWWLVVCQRERVLVGALLGSTWMVGLTLPPYLLSRAVDEGLRPGQLGSLLGWAAALLGVGVVNAWLSIMRHRTMSRIRMEATFRTVDVVVEHAVRLGAALARKARTGEVVTIGITDVLSMSQSLTITGPGVGAAIAYLVVAGLLLSLSPLLAGVVLLGVPVLAVAIGPLLGRLQRVGMSYRDRQGGLTARMVDIVDGLGVLNGVGGKGLYAEKYRRESQDLQSEGYRVGAVASVIQAMGVGLPALFLAAVIWLAARMVAQGTLTVGQLIAVYGYIAVLVVSVSSFIEGATDLSRALVSARRTIRFLSIEADSATVGAPGPAGPATLHDPTFGVVVAPGTFTAVVTSRQSESTAVIDRLGGFTDSTATWGGLRLRAIGQDELRNRILVADNTADIFSGTLREVLTGRSDRPDDLIMAAVAAAAAGDIVAALPEGLDSMIEPQGRNLSGGQRQRVRLARALVADPEILLAPDPTSAVDAHTEAAIAARLREVRAGRITVVTTTSPLLLEHADVVHFLADGHVAATGTHRELLASTPDYRRLVIRGADEDRVEVVSR